MIQARSKKILLIEDEKDILSPLTYRLKRKGFEVISAQDGEAGLNEARKEIPDLIILDLFLPKLSGEEVCKALRESEDEALENIPILMLTAKGSDVDRIVGKVIGANAYMTKPYEIKDLLLQIDRLTEHSRVHSIPTSSILADAFPVPAPDVHVPISRLRVLYMGDNFKLYHQYKQILAQEKDPVFELLCCADLQNGSNSLSKGLADVVVLDLDLEKGGKSDTFCALQRQFPFMPIVILSNLDDEQMAFQSVRQGAQDYLVKDKIHGKMLARVLRYAVERKKSEEKLKILNATLEERVAERTRAAEQKASDLEDLSSVLENAVEGISRLDCQGRYVSMNYAYANILGHSPDTLVGIDWEVGVHPDDRAKVKAAFHDLEKTEKAEVDARGIRKDGNVFYKQLVIMKAYDPQKQFVGYYCFMKDITERKTKEYKEALDIKYQFISTVSHELRTPLHAIKEGIGIVLDGSAGDVNTDQTEFLDIAKKNVDRLSRLINNVLDFQKLDCGGMEYDVKEYDLRAVISEIEKMMGPAVQSKGLTLAVEHEAGLPKLRFDKDRITQVFVNLIHNAVKYTKTGQIKITTARDTNTVRISITDTGIGIRELDIPKLFKTFAQLPTDQNRETAGTGLGLAIVKKIIDQHGGKIWSESVYGQGSTFSFLLPIRERRN